jgi:hypothetical protein
LQKKNWVYSIKENDKCRLLTGWRPICARITVNVQFSIRRGQRFSRTHLKIPQCFALYKVVSLNRKADKIKRPQKKLMFDFNRQHLTSAAHLLYTEHDISRLPFVHFLHKRRLKIILYKFMIVVLTGYAFFVYLGSIFAKDHYFRQKIVNQRLCYTVFSLPRTYTVHLCRRDVMIWCADHTWPQIKTIHYSFMTFTFTTLLGISKVFS